MQKRLHGILSDIVIRGAQPGGNPKTPLRTRAEVRQVVGDRLAGMTATVHLPAMLSFQVGSGEWITRQVKLIGIDRGHSSPGQRLRPVPAAPREPAAT